MSLTPPTTKELAAPIVLDPMGITILPEEESKPLAKSLQSTGATVHTEVFEGPFDLLLHLILKDEVDLYEVSLQQIIDSYLAELEKMDHCDLEVATEFLLIASTLIDLKVRRLLPSSGEIDLDDELALWEERDLLLSRLLECKTFKDAARNLEGLAEYASLSMPRISGIEEPFLELAPDLLAGVTAGQLRNSFLRMVAPRPEPTVSLDHITQIKVSVSEVMSILVTRLSDRPAVSFREMTRGCRERIEVVVHFLAVLELFKLGAVELDQSVSFGALMVHWVGNEDDVDSIMANADVYEG